MRYREAEELAAWKLRDPLAVARARLADLGVDAEVADGIDRDVEAEVRAAIDEARRSRSRTRRPCSTSCAVEEDDTPEREPEQGEVFKTMDAVREALDLRAGARPHGVRGRASTSAGAATSSASPGAWPTGSPAGCATPRSRRRPSSAVRWVPPWRACGPSSRSCTWTSSASAWTR